MLKICQKLISLVLVMSVSSLLGVGESGAAFPTVEIVVTPNKTTVYAGSDPIVLTARATGANLTFSWTLLGPGKLEGTDLPAIFYLAPEKIQGKSAQAVITVIVADRTGQETTESITFNILPSPAPEPTEQPSPAKPKSKGMSTGTKVALGVGAATLVGGGIALAVGGGDDDGKPSFTGTFRNEFDKWTNDGITPMHVINILKLTQNGSSVTGTMESSAAFGNCCTASFTIPVTGTVNGNFGTLSWPYTEDWCWGDNCSYGLNSMGGRDYSAELVDNGRILRIYDWGDVYRMSVMNRSGTGNEINGRAFPISGDFIRQ